MSAFTVLYVVRTMYYVGAGIRIYLTIKPSSRLITAFHLDGVKQLSITSRCYSD